MATTLNDVTIETFEPLVGTTFRVNIPDGLAVELKLTEVTKRMEGVRSKKLKRQPFSLFFEGANTFFLQQHTFELTHPQFDGVLPMFLVPVGQEAGAFQYEAVFT